MNLLQYLAPELILSIGGTAVLLAGSIRGGAALGDFLRWVSMITVAGAAGALLSVIHEPPQAIANGWLISSSVNVVFALTFMAIIAWTLLASAVPGDGAGEWYGLLLFTGVGMLTLARAGNLAALFLGVEVLSLGLYVLIAFRYTNVLSLHAGIMYLVLAGFGSGFLVFGLALVYAVQGTLDMPGLEVWSTMSGRLPLIALIGYGLFFVGVGFKLSLVPFHMWAPEIYEASPGPISGLIASASKGAIVAALVPLLFVLRSHWQIVWALSAASMIGGNLLALRETRVKRILAYSSIGHVGYIMMGYLAGWSTPGEAPRWTGNVAMWDDIGSTISGVRSIAFYVIAYAPAILGAFGVLALMDRDHAVTLRDLRGLGRKHPVLSLCLMVFVISLAGLPPSAGFFGKLYLFGAAVAAGYVRLPVIGLVASAIGIFYYLRIIVHLFMLPQHVSEVRVTQTGLQRGVLVATAVFTVLLGIFPDMLNSFLHPR